MRYFIVHTTAKCFVEKYKSSISGGNFSYNLKNAGLFDITYSILPSNIYDYTEKLDIDGINIVYSNIRSKSKVSRILGCLVEQCKLFRIIKSNSSVWLYNICILNALLFLLLKLFKPTVKINVIVADFTPNEGINSLFLRLINKADGLITLSNSNLFHLNNHFILPGIVPIDESYHIVNSPIKRNFLLSGALNERIASTSMVMKAFQKLTNLELNITGRGIDADLITEFSNLSDNIKYHGVLSYEEFKTMLDDNVFVLSTRDPHYPENQCNFPSKVLEALLHNRIIISTIHYPQLEGLLYFEVPSDYDGFINAINEIAQLSDDKLLQYANQSEKVKKLFSPSAWQHCIKLIETNE